MHLPAGQSIRGQRLNWSPIWLGKQYGARQMSIKVNQSERLTAMNIDAGALEILRELRPLVAEHIDAAIATAFGQILRFPEVQQVYAGINLEEAKLPLSSFPCSFMIPFCSFIASISTGTILS